MKRVYLLFIVLLLNLMVFSEKKNIYNFSITKNTIGFDIGGINNDNVYSKLDFGFSTSDLNPSYFNLGVGYFFNGKYTIGGLLGLYFPINTHGVDLQKPIKINIGTEFGYLFNDDLLSTIFITNNTIGIKFGIRFKSDLDN